MVGNLVDPCLTAVFLFGIVISMEQSVWYLQLIKPSWAPPSWLFGPVWSVLYLLIAISFGRVFLMFYKKQIPFLVLLPFVLNLVFNFAFTSIQFGIQNNYLAAIDIILVLGTLVWAMIVIYPFKKWITFIQIPYLAWVSFATVLQVTITFLNI
ncbi:MAG: benzodiazapine receptor [Candidatus Paceibacteria bacterium]